MSKRIGNYELEKPLSNRDAGSSKWGFGTKEGKEYFIKEFLTPVCPVDNVGLDKTTIERKKRLCKEFEDKESFIIRKINNASDGNILRIHEFFRYGTKYYITAEKVNALDEHIVDKISLADKIKILKVLSHSMSCLHKYGIVHGDIKMSNIMFMRTRNGMITGKIIDIDGCFFENNLPNPEYIVVDPVYMAPETFQYIATESGTINCKVDVFAMGIVFYQILTGKMLEFDKKKYAYAYECVLDGGSLIIDSLPEYLYEVITNMLCRNPEERFSMEEVFNILTEKIKTDYHVNNGITKKDEFFTKAGNL